MLPHSTPDLPNSRERLSLKPLSLNIPIPNHQASSKGQNPLDNLIQPRSPPPTSDRKNKSASLKTIAQLKQILSKSLFHKKPPLECQIKQKPKDDLACRKSDSKPISPQSQQKQRNIIKQSVGGVTPQIFEENEGENQASISQLLDSKFNNFLDINLSNEQDLGLQIESKFTSIKSKNSKQDHQVELLQPTNAQFQHIAAHEKLLQEENTYIRQQLIIFTQTIDTQRIKSHELKHKAKTYQRQNHKLKERNKILFEELADRQEKYYQLSISNDQNAAEVAILQRGKKEMLEKMEDLTKEHEEIFYKLQNYETIKEREIEAIIEQKNKEKDILSEELSEKEKEIFELNEFVQQLKQQITNLQQNANKNEDKVNNSMSQDDQVQKSQSICLSLAEAQSLKNIIQTKQNMFQREIDTLKRKSQIFQSQTQKQISQLTDKLKQYETQKSIISQQQITQTKQYISLKNNLQQQIQNLQHNLTEQQRNNKQMSKQILQLQQKYSNIDMQQDEQLQDLLQNCVQQLQKQRKINNVLRQQIANLKKVFAKELHYVQQIQSKMFFN